MNPILAKELVDQVVQKTDTTLNELMDSIKSIQIPSDTTSQELFMIAIVYMLNRVHNTIGCGLFLDMLKEIKSCGFLTIGIPMLQELLPLIMVLDKSSEPPVSPTVQ